MKKIFLFFILFLCVSCNNKKDPDYTIYTRKDFYITYNKNNDYYVCEFKHYDNIYYVKSDDVEVRFIPNEWENDYELYVANNVAYKLIIYIGVDD